MKKNGGNGAEEQIIEFYHQTTSSRSSPIDERRFAGLATHLKRRLGRWLPDAGQSVLDLGCGTGELLYLMSERGCTPLNGVNLCQEEIDKAREFVPATFHHCDLLEFLKLTNDTYDWIGCLNILEHLSKDEVLETLQLCNSRLRPGGSLVVMVPNGLSAYSGVTRYWDFTHKIAFVPNNFRQLLPLCGFDKVEFAECAPVPYGFMSSIRFALWQLVRQLIKLRLLIEVADAKEGIYSMDMLVKLSKR
jgi:2-polyprenyl-3-methyl-5-hydroxy-6-metoxy-1,4-benzoquinol methylase